MPTWMADAGDDFRIFATRVSGSGNIRLMWKFGTVCRRLLSFLASPDAVREFCLRNAIYDLDETRAQTSLSEVALPVALWIILCATESTTAISASRVLETTARDVANVHILGLS
ncbi:MAG: hypothetical protein AAB386_04090 [Patescibacteria group bacterium]